MPGMASSSSTEVKAPSSTPSPVDELDAIPGIGLVDRGEGAVLLAIVDDLLGRDRADSRERVELSERGGAQVHRSGCRARRSTPGIGGTRARLLRGNHDLLAVDDRRSKVHELRVGTRSRPARTPHGVRYARSEPQAIEPRSPNRSDSRA